jgi:hypothetical protein
VLGPSGLDKRMATIHPTIRAKGEQLAPCWVIFRGEGIQLSEEEKRFLDSLKNIKWAFQSKVQLAHTIASMNT